MKKILTLFFLLCVFLHCIPAQDGSRGIVTLVPGDPKEEEVKPGKRYAICIGVNNYQDSEIKDLQKAQNDAKALGKILEEFGKFDEVFVLTDDIDPQYDRMGVYPKLPNIRERWKSLNASLRPEDMVVISFSGHGITNESGKSYLLTADTSFDSVFSTSLPVEEMVDWLDSIGIKKSIMFLDACRNQITETASRGLTKEGLKAERFEGAEVSAIFYATKTGLKSYEDIASDYGIFTRFLLEGIRGKADYQFGNSDGLVTFRELARFVQENVTNYALNLDRNQRPSVQFNSEVFGDLAVSTYGGKIDTASRKRVSLEEERDFGSGRGTLEVFSNVDGTVILDGESKGRIKAGEIVVLKNIEAGEHFLEVKHSFGYYQNEAPVYTGETTELANKVVNQERENKVVDGITFVYVSGKGRTRGFWISETEISLGHFGLFAGESGYSPSDDWDAHYKTNYDYFPVTNVSKEDAEAFAEWFSERTGERVGLPTQEQWEFAAGGKLGRSYPWGNIWNDEYCHNGNKNRIGMLPVMGNRGPVQIMNFYNDITLDGVMGMAGNLREWCADESEYRGKEMGVIAGGSWTMDRGTYFQAGHSTKKPASYTDEDLGFRLILKD